LVTLRRGATALGCLFTMMVVGAVLYFGVNIGRVYWRCYEYQDDMRQEARFASHRSNDQIIVHLRASADSLGLPEGATQISIRRSQAYISIEADYYENVELPMYVKELHLHPHAEGPL
jgi:hypothetical protein